MGNNKSEQYRIYFAEIKLQTRTFLTFCNLKTNVVMRDLVSKERRSGQIML
jgi:hypothetical protein